MSFAATAEAAFTAPPDSWHAANVSRTQAIVNCRAHYLIAQQRERQHRALGIPATIIAAAVAAFTFSAPKGALVTVLGIGATVGAVLVGLQTFLAPSDAARNHRAAGAEYGAIRRSFDLAIAQGDGPHILSALETLYPELNRLALASPVIPDRYYKRAYREIKAEPNIGRGEPFGQPPGR